MPGIALSGYGREDDIHRSREAGFTAHLVKPASPDRLIETVRKVLAGNVPEPASLVADYPPDLSTIVMSPSGALSPWTMGSTCAVTVGTAADAGGAEVASDATTTAARRAGRSPRVSRTDI